MNTISDIQSTLYNKTSQHKVEEKKALNKKVTYEKRKRNLTQPIFVIVMEVTRRSQKNTLSGRSKNWHTRNWKSVIMTFDSLRVIDANHNL